MQPQGAHKVKARKYPTPKRGFTLIEVLVVAPIVILSIGAFIALIVTLTADTVASRGSSVLQYEVHDALSRIEEDIRRSAAFLATNDITLEAANPQGYTSTPSTHSTTGSTVPFTNINTNKALILKQFATKEKQRQSTQPGIIYLSNTPNACTGEYKKNTPMYVNIVYYIAEDSLWRRTITPTNYDTSSAFCNGPVEQRPSCGPGTLHIYCKTEDTKLVSGVNQNGFTFRYYATAAATTAYANTGADSVRNTALAPLLSVEVELSAERSIAGKDIIKSGKIRTTRMNSLP